MNIFTYLIPICPLAFAWDGFVSCLRTYSPAELRANHLLMSSGTIRESAWPCI